MGGLCEERFVWCGKGWRTRETGSGDGEMGTVTEGEGKQKSMTNFDASLVPDFRDKQESINMADTWPHALTSSSLLAGSTSSL